MKRSLRRRGDERGAVLVMSVVGFVVAVLAAALAVDLGSLAQEKRTDQKVADLASLDAVRGLNDSYILGLSHPLLTLLSPKQLRANVLAKESALRNGYDPADAANGHDMKVVLGSKDTSQPRNFRQTCPPIPPAVVDCLNVTAVKVSISSKVPYSFRGGDQTVTVSSVAFQQDVVPTTTIPPTTVPPVPPTTVPPGPDSAGFSVGSSLLTLTPSQSALLNPIIGQMIGGTTLTGVGWQGLANGTITVTALQTQLASMNLTVGSVSQLLDTELTLAQLYQATASVMTLNGDTANANAFNLLKAAATFTTKIKLGDFLNVASGAEGTFLGSKLNLFQLVSASAQAEALDGNHAVNLSDVGVAVGGVASTALSLSVIDPPKMYFGLEGGPSPALSTSQVDLTITPKLNLPVTIDGLVNAKVRNDLPIRIQVAGAKAFLKDINCGASKSITVNVDPSAFSGSASGSLLVTATVKVLGIPVLDSPLLRIPTTNVVPNTNAAPVDVNFAYTSEFSPPAPGKSIGSQPLGLGDLTEFTPGDPEVLGELTVPVGTTVDAVLAALKPVLDDVDALVVSPLIDALGLSIGNADVNALALNCLVTPPPVSTTTTVPPPPTTTTTPPPPASDGPPVLIG